MDVVKVISPQPLAEREEQGGWYSARLQSSLGLSAASSHNNLFVSFAISKKGLSFWKES